MIVRSTAKKRWSQYLVSLASDEQFFNLAPSNFSLLSTMALIPPDRDDEDPVELLLEQDDSLRGGRSLSEPIE